MHHRLQQLTSQYDLELVYSQLPVFPMPVLVSKLYVLLRGECPAIQHSHSVFSYYLWFEQQCVKLSNLKRAQVRKIINHKKDIFQKFVLFSNNTLSLFFSLQFTDHLVTQYMEENFYDTVNLIRITEFTILELLQVPKKEHYRFVTSIDQPEWPADPQFWALQHNPYLERVYKDTADILTTKYKKKENEKHDWNKEIIEAPKNVQNWMNKEILRSLFAVSKITLSSNPFYCGNRKTCTKKEDKTTKFMQCSQCLWVRYCSKECQTAEWRAGHKDICNKPATKELLQDLLKGRRLIIGQEDEESTD